MNKIIKKAKEGITKKAKLPDLPMIKLKSQEIDFGLRLKKEGRPSVINSLVIAKLETAFGWGCTDEEACVYGNISMSTLYRYQNKFPEFCDRKELLKNRPVFLARQKVVSEIQTNANLAYRFLRDKKPDEFGKNDWQNNTFNNNQTYFVHEEPYQIIAREINNLSSDAKKEAIITLEEIAKKEEV